jgi:hypothetical protein
MELDTTIIRSLAAGAGRTTREVIELLRNAGMRVGHGGQRLEGEELRRARRILELDSRASDRPARNLSPEELRKRLLRPLVCKGKFGRQHTTPFENLYGRGLPDHQKHLARALAEELLRSGVLKAKISQGRRHVWLTPHGRGLLDE